MNDPKSTSAKSETLVLPRPPARGLSFRANVSWALTGSLVNSTANWATLLILARLSDPETVGTFALALAISGPVFTFFNFQLRAIQATDASHKYSPSIFIKVRLTTSTVALIFIALYACLVLDDTRTQSVLLFYSFNLACISLSEVVFGHFQQIGRQDWVARSQAVRGILSPILLASIFLSTSSLSSATAGLTLASLIPLLMLDLPASRQLRSQVPIHSSLRPLSEELLELSRSAIPLGATMLLLSLNLNLPRYFLEAYTGRQELGIFSALSQLIAAGSLVIAAIGQAMSPRLARAYKTGLIRRFKHDLARFAGLAGLVSISGILLSAIAGREILTFIYGSTYAAASSVLLLLSIGGSLAFIAGVAGSALTACGFHGIQPLLFSATVLITAISGYTLIPNYGTSGAAITVIASSLTQLVVSWGALLYRLRRPTNER